MSFYASLPTVKTLSDTVSIVKHDQLDVLRVQHPHATAAIALHGAHVLSYQPTGEQDVLWLSQTAILDGQAPIRGGIPICWPWFGHIAIPQHGFARTQTWTLETFAETEGATTLTLALSDTPETRAIWPHAFSLILDIQIGKTLHLALRTTNTDNTPWPISAALHTYLHTGDIRQSRITGMGPSYQDKLQDYQLCQGTETFAITTPVDRIYTAPEAHIQCHDPVFNRTLDVANAGHNVAVIWNPWDTAVHILDMDDEAYLRMCCIESTLYAPTIEAGVVIQPGETQTLSTTIQSV